MKQLAKILHVIPSIAKKHGGPSNAIKTIERAIVNHDFYLATTDEGLEQKFEIYNIKKRSNYSVFKLTALPYKVSLAFFIWSIRNIKKYEIIHVHGLFSFTSVVASLIALWFKVPLIVRPLGVLNNYGMQRKRLIKTASFLLIESRILRKATRVHCTSVSEQSEIQKLILEFNPVIIPLALDKEVNLFNRETSNSEKSTFSVLYLSRIDNKKNIENLLVAISLLKEWRYSIAITIAGGGNVQYIFQLKSLAIKLGIDSIINWTGYVDGVKKRKVFEDAEIFVLPSFSENFGIAVLEALSFGLPCVVSRDVAISYEIEMYGAGTVVDLDPYSIANGIRHYLEDKSSISIQSSNAIELVKNEFSFQQLSTRLSNLYSEILDEKYK